MAFVIALINSFITILLTYTSGSCVCVRVCYLLVLSSHEHTKTVIASWWVGKLMSAEENDTWSALSVCIYCKPLIMFLPPGLSLSSLNSSILPTSSSTGNMRIFVSHSPSLMSSFSPVFFPLAPSLFSADWIVCSREDWVGMLCLVCAFVWLC